MKDLYKIKTNEHDVQLHSSSVSLMSTANILKSNICSSEAVFIILFRVAYILLYTCEAHLDVAGYDLLYT